MCYSCTQLPFRASTSSHRTVYLGVVGLLFALPGCTRRLREFGQPGRRSQIPRETEEARRGRMLAHAANTMGAPRVALAWEDEEEPWLQIAFWEDGHTTLSRAAPDDFSPLVPTDLKGTIFLCPDARGGSQVLTTYGGEPESPPAICRCPPFHHAFADRFDMGPASTAPVNAAEGEARLFFLDNAAACHQMT